MNVTSPALSPSCRISRINGLLGAIVGVALFLTTIDGLSVEFKEGPNVTRVLAGESVSVGGPCPDGVSAPEEVRVVGLVEGLSVRVTGVASGFWLGGRNWKGVLSAAPGIETQETTFSVAHGQAKPLPGHTFKVKVFGTPTEMRQAAPSLVFRYLGVQPGLLAGVLAGIFALTLGVSYFVSDRISAELARNGRAEIYRVQDDPQGARISFGLGSSHGLAPGDEALIVSAAGEPLGTARVVELKPCDAQAIMLDGRSARAGDWATVSRITERGA